LSCKIAQDPEGKSRGFGFVHYETEEAAKTAIEKLNGMNIGTKTVFVGLFQKHADREDGTPKQFTNVYLKHIPETWDDEKVRAAIVDFGTVTSFVVKVDPKGRRFAFANFEEFDQAKACVDALHGKDMRTEEQKAAQETMTQEEKDELEAEKDEDIYTYQLYCTRAQNKSERQAELKSKFVPSANSSSASLRAPGGNNLYIKNLSETVDDEGLKAMFEPFGQITSAKVMRDDKGESRCFGFVCFANPEDATKAVTDMHLKLINGKPLYVGLHEKKDQRIERLQSRYRVPQGMQPGMGPQGMMMRPGAGGFPQAGGMYGFGGPRMPGAPMGVRPAGPPQMMGGYPRPSGPMPYMVNPQMRGMMQPGAGPMAGGMPKPGMPRPAGMMQPGAMRTPGGPIQPGVAGRMPQYPGARMGAPQMEMSQFDPNGPLTAAALAAAPPAMQKQMLGEKLFPAIARIQPELAGKITGMMLEMDNSELLILLESEQQLRYKVDEALRVLQG
jgi:polyadenylate-binding protein